MRYAYQDGDTFFDSETDEVLAVYSHLVANDNRGCGAERARTQFLLDYPDYSMEEGA